MPVALSTGLGAAKFGLASVLPEPVTDAAAAGCLAIVASNPHCVAGATALILDVVYDEIEIEEDEREKRKQAKTFPG